MSGAIKIIKNFIHLLQSIVANMYYGFPQRKLKLIGVTGTDGKTTTTQMIYHILKYNGFKTAYLSTISAKIGEKELDTGFHVTTPDPWMVPKYLKMMVKEGAEYVVIEATSSGLAQNRLWGITFVAGAITNIRSDHLDYHGTWENYAKAKAKLLDMIKDGGIAALNNDDTSSLSFLKEYVDGIDESELKIIWYSKDKLTNVESSFKGLEFDYEDEHFNLPLIGSYNLDNALAAICLTKKYLPISKISEALNHFPTPLGRMQVMQIKPFSVIIDFAHTPHALRSALNSVREISDKGRIISVFGCAGQRDVGRREMGKIAARWGEIMILTSEDPRDEKLKDINAMIIKQAMEKNGELIKEFNDHEEFEGRDINNIKEGLEKSLLSSSTPIIAFNEDSIKSRQDAIKLALEIAQDNDIVFITGKAHERSMAFKGVEYPWNEQEEVKKALE